MRTPNDDKMPELKIRLFPPRFEARGKDAIDTLRRPLVLLTIVAATLVICLCVLFLTHSRASALLSLVVSRWH